jgi:CRISPR-associated exonuclease Cas4
MGFKEEHFLMLSGIQHFQFCKRQWALIHIEQQWEENVLTIQGQHLHKKADQPFLREKRKGKLIVRGMPVQSRKMRVNGICDVVEFIEDDEGIGLHGSEGLYQPYPVEYKRGKPKSGDPDILQLTAQAMCLEEMLVCEITHGFLYYNETKHRVKVPINDKHRNKVRSVLGEMQEYYRRRHTPKVKTGTFCSNCSLQHICMPTLMNKRSVTSYIERKLSE